MITEEIVTFNNRRGERLVGIVSVPAPARKKERGIVLLNSGLNYRVAWHRLNVKLARFLSSEGYPVLRFDPRGVGDSEGELPAGDIFKHYNAIERGEFVPDVLDAVAFFVRTGRCREVVLVGLCGGAITAMRAAARERRVRGVVHVAGPVTFSEKKVSGAAHPFEADDLLALYLRKLFSLRGWLRLLGGRSQYNAAGAALRVAVRSRLRGTAPASGGKALNAGFIGAFRAYCGSGGKALFVLAERDGATREFFELFAKKHLAPGSRYASSCSVRVIPRTNHIFSSRQAQGTLRSLLGEWLKTGEYDDQTIHLHRQLGNQTTAAPMPELGV